MKFESHLKVNIPNMFQLEDFHVQIHDRMIFHPCSVLSVSCRHCYKLTDSAAFCCCRFKSESESERCLFARSNSMQLILAEVKPNCFFLSLFFNRIPNLLIILDCVVQFESHKLGTAPLLFSLCVHLPLCLSVDFTLSACLYHTSKFCSLLTFTFLLIRSQSYSAVFNTLATLFI